MGATGTIQGTSPCGTSSHLTDIAAAGGCWEMYHGWVWSLFYVQQMQKATVALAHWSTRVGYGCPKLGPGCEEVVGHMIDTVHLLPKQAELTTTSVSGVTRHFFRLKYPSNTESCQHRKKQHPMSTKHSRLSPSSFLVKREKTKTSLMEENSCIHQRPGISKEAEDGLVCSSKVPPQQLVLPGCS